MDRSRRASGYRQVPIPGQTELRCSMAELDARLRSEDEVGAPAILPLIVLYSSYSLKCGRTANHPEAASGDYDIDVDRRRSTGLGLGLSDTVEIARQDDHVPYRHGPPSAQHEDDCFGNILWFD